MVSNVGSAPTRPPVRQISLLYLRPSQGAVKSLCDDGRGRIEWRRAVDSAKDDHQASEMLVKRPALIPGLAQADSPGALPPCGFHAGWRRRLPADAPAHVGELRSPGGPC